MVKEGLIQKYWKGMCKGEERRKDPYTCEKTKNMPKK